MRPHEYAAYRRPFPRTACTELLAIDDHLTSQVCTRRELRDSAHLRDTEVFTGSERAYPSVGLVQHPRKRQRNVTAGIVLGAEADGITGIISAPRHRVGVLMRITCTIARKGCCSSDLLSSVLGLWIHVLMFRRPVLAVLTSVFEDARRAPRDAVYQLQRSSINELFCLAALAPLLQADLRVDYPGLLFCMDASPTGAGLCAAKLPPATVKELWRFSEQKGFYTKLLEPAGATLAAAGLDDDPGSYFASNVGEAQARGFLHLFGSDQSWATLRVSADSMTVWLGFTASVRLLHAAWRFAWVLSLSFRDGALPDLRYKFAKPGHINVLESRTYKTWIK
ncbi:Kcnc2, partial [Symbiodinium necroappetens]